MSSRKCKGCGEFFSTKINACPSCGAEYQGAGQEKKGRFEGGTKFDPIPPCSCGQPQVCAVKTSAGLIAKCADCYARWWSPERISTKEPASISKVVQEIRAAYEKSIAYARSKG
jgi:rRNA maturation endonuclease Nob1